VSRDRLTADEYLRLPGLPRRAELIQGIIVVPGWQYKWHNRMRLGLMEELDRQAPDELRAWPSMSVKLDEWNVPDPDVAVISAEALMREVPDDHCFAADLVLAVEVVSSGSEVLDQDVKPPLYARAGVRHFWRVDRDEGRAVVYVHELEATGAYGLSGVHRGRLKVTVPYDIDIDLTSVWERRRRA